MIRFAIHDLEIEPFEYASRIVGSVFDVVSRQWPLFGPRVAVSDAYNGLGIVRATFVNNPARARSSKFVPLKKFAPTKSPKFENRIEQVALLYVLQIHRNHQFRNFRGPRNVSLRSRVVYRQRLQ